MFRCFHTNILVRNGISFRGLDQTNPGSAPVTILIIKITDSCLLTFRTSKEYWRASYFQNITKRKWRDREGNSGRWPGYVMSTKVIFSPAEVCFPRRPRAVLCRSQVLSDTSSAITWNLCFSFKHQTEVGLHADTSEDGPARTKTFARLKIAFVDMTYPKGWTASLPLCPLIFSWYYSS